MKIPEKVLNVCKVVACKKFARIAKKVNEKLTEKAAKLNKKGMISIIITLLLMRKTQKWKNPQKKRKDKNENKNENQKADTQNKN